MALIRLSRCLYENSATSSRRERLSFIAASGGRDSYRLAASSTLGSRHVTDRVEEDPGPPERPVHREIDVGLLAQRLVPGGRRLGAAVPGGAAMLLIVWTAMPRSGRRTRAPRSRSRSARPASARGCRGASTESNGNRSRLRRCILGR